MCEFLNVRPGGTQCVPPGFLSAQEIALQHTLLPFLMRFQPQEKKAAILEAFLNGEDMRPRYLRATRDIKPRSMRYCPICVREDTQTYGEPYWRREHQIGIMPLCPRHRCRLRDKPIPNTRPLGAQYLPLDGQDWAEPDYGALGYETALTGTQPVISTAFCVQSIRLPVRSSSSLYS